MTTTLLSNWQTQTAADVAALGGELGTLIAAVRAFKAQASSLVGRVQRTAERIAGALQDVEDARGEEAPPGLLDKLTELPSCDPDDALCSAIDALIGYRSELRAMARYVTTISANAPSDVSDVFRTG